MSTQSKAEYLVSTPPWCPTVECWMHGNGEAHHVEGCPVAETLHGQMHRLGHAIAEAIETLRPNATVVADAFKATWRGRLTYYWLRLRGRWPW